MIKIEHGFPTRPGILYIIEIGPRIMQTVNVIIKDDTFGIKGQVGKYWYGIWWER